MSQVHRGGLFDNETRPIEVHTRLDFFTSLLGLRDGHDTLFSPKLFHASTYHGGYLTDLVYAETVVGFVIEVHEKVIRRGFLFHDEYFLVSLHSLDVFVVKFVQSIIRHGQASAVQEHV